MNQPKVFEYMVVFHPTEEGIKEGDRSRILIEPTLILAENQEDAERRSVEAIPPVFKDKPFLLLIHEWGK